MSKNRENNSRDDEEGTLNWTKSIDADLSVTESSASSCDVTAVKLGKVGWVHQFGPKHKVHKPFEFDRRVTKGKNHDQTSSSKTDIKSLRSESDNDSSLIQVKQGNPNVKSIYKLGSARLCNCDATKRNSRNSLQKSLELAHGLLNGINYIIEKNHNDPENNVQVMEQNCHDLNVKMNQFQTYYDSSRLSTVKSELKFKKFELDRLSVLYEDVKVEYNNSIQETEKLNKKLEDAKQELSNLSTQSGTKITYLMTKLQQKEAKLEEYESLEEDLDNLVIQAASLPRDQDDDGILAQFYNGSSLPINAKRRLGQSLNLARRVLELEQRTIELKKELFHERDQKQELISQLRSATEGIEQARKPTTELIQLVQKADSKVYKAKKVNKDLQVELETARNENNRLQSELKQVNSHCDRLAELLLPSSRINQNSNGYFLLPNQYKFPKQLQLFGGANKPSNNIHINKPLIQTKITRSEIL